MIVTTSGQVIRLQAKDVPNLGRDTIGVNLIIMSGCDNIDSVAKIEEEIEEITEE